MDPLSVVSIVAATCQFVDFGAQLFTESYRIHRRGASHAQERVADLARVSRELAMFSQNMADKTAPLVSPNHHPLGVSETALLQECRRCEDACRDISMSISLIRRMDEKARKIAGTGASGPGNSKWESFRTALSLVWNSGEVREMESRLKEIRSNLMLAMVSDLWYGTYLTYLPTNLPCVPAVIRVQIGAWQHMYRYLLTCDMHRSRNANPAELEKPTRNQTLVEQVNPNGNISATRKQAPEFIFSYRTLDQDLQDAPPPDVGRTASGIDDAACSKALIHSLSFEVEGNREKAIPKAYESTYEWIFKGPVQQQQQQQPGNDVDPQPSCWSDFPAWLEHDSRDVYWITGKPGSGKSTMMKYLAHHVETRLHLQKWSYPRPVLISAFYSWNAGTELEKSQEGLLRSLLRQILEQAPQLGPLMFPARWAMLKIFGKHANQRFPPWGWTELFETITAFTVSAHRMFNLAIFIDGLDEFPGDYGRLIGLVNQFHGRLGIKVCVSSRPWNEFRDVFLDCPQLHMELLTREDMKRFVHGSF